MLKVITVEQETALLQNPVELTKLQPYPQPGVKLPPSLKRELYAKARGFELVYTVSNCFQDYQYAIVPFGVPGHSNFLVLNMSDPSSVKVTHIEPNGDSFAVTENTDGRW